MQRTKDAGLAEIDNAEWVFDNEFFVFNLHVLDKDQNDVHCWIVRRPAYCDRGHLQLNIDGPLGLDEQDRFPRYFFTFDEADKHTRNFLKWRLWKTSDSL
jgi:hypothetical protein